jgi:hypothetical protein
MQKHAQSVAEWIGTLFNMWSLHSQGTKNLASTSWHKLTMLESQIPLSFGSPTENSPSQHALPQSLIVLILTFLQGSLHQL